MKIKTGIDIIEVSRVQEAIEKNGEMFLNKVFSKSEIEFCESTNKMKYQHYAARFAAKEAVYKAISDIIADIKEDIWKNIIIKNGESGKPFVEFNGTLDFLNIGNNTNELINNVVDDNNLKNSNTRELKIESMDLSISHIKDYAIANFVMLINE
jgi:holo-[acyl-carrier protein] synthase